MFSSRLLLNLALVIFLAALISLALIINNKEKPASVFSQLNKKDISTVLIEHNNIITQIDNSANTWRITKPVTVEADDFRIQAILNLLNEPVNTYYDIEPSDYKKFSLDPALANLKLGQQEFLFGSTSAVNNMRYVLTNNKLFLVEDTFYPLITAGYKNLMRRYLFDSHTEFTDIRFNDTHVYQNNKASWQADKLQTSADDLKRYVDNWKYIQAYAVTAATAPYSGIKVTFTTAENKVIVRFLQKTDINTVVINPQTGLSYQFDISAFESLTKPGFYSTAEAK